EADNGEYLEAAEAVLRVYDRQDWLRPNRARARIKVFVDKFGIEELLKQVEEERKGDWVAERNFDVARLRMDIDEQAGAPPLNGGYASPNGDLREFEAFKQYNVRPQRQQGFSAVEV